MASNKLASTSDIKMGHKCPSIMDHQAHWKTVKTHTPEQCGNVPRYFHVYCFHAYAHKIKHMAYPDPQPDPCKDLLVVYHTKIFSIYVEFVKKHVFP